MTIISQVMEFIKKLFDWWFFVLPWEQAIFVRGGKKVKLLTAGWYFKIPFIDLVFKQTIRTRIIDLPFQTITNKNGKTITIKSNMQYSIGDMYKLYNSISHPEVYIYGVISGYVSQAIKNSDNLDLDIVEYEVNSKLVNLDLGLKELQFKITSWADVRTFRMIQDGSWMTETLNMEHIDNK